VAGVEKPNQSVSIQYPVLSRESKLTVYNWLTVKTERQSKQASSSRRAAQDQRILGVKQAMATQLGRREERNQLKKKQGGQ